MWKLILNIGNAYAQDLIPCPDGSMADPSIGCVLTPGSVIDPESSLIQITLNIANGLMVFIIGIAVAFLIYGGIRYAIAAGNDEEIDKAKRILFWSIFGLIIALLAQFITRFILGILA